MPNLGANRNVTAEPEIPSMYHPVNQPEFLGLEPQNAISGIGGHSVMSCLDGWDHYLCSITRGKFSEKQKDRLTKSVQTFRRIPFHARFRLVPADLFLSFLAGNSFPR